MQADFGKETQGFRMQKQQHEKQDSRVSSRFSRLRNFCFRDKIRIISKVSRADVSITYQLSKEVHLIQEWFYQFCILV